MMVPLGTGPVKTLIGTRSGMFVYDGTGVKRFSTEIDGWIKKNNLTHGIRLNSSPGEFALATRRGGQR